MPEKPDKPLCASEGCGRPAETEHPFCETCCLERALYRRDYRHLLTGEHLPPVR
jgi:hypothetical protein